MVSMHIVQVSACSICLGFERCPVACGSQGDQRRTFGVAVTAAPVAGDASPPAWGQPGWVGSPAQSTGETPSAAAGSEDGCRGWSAAAGGDGSGGDVSAGISRPSASTGRLGRSAGSLHSQSSCRCTW